jgi:hypothetical protein
MKVEQYICQKTLKIKSSLYLDGGRVERKSEKKRVRKRK